MSIRKLFKSPRFYVRFNKERVAARNVNTGDEVEFAAKLAIDDNKIVVSVGDPVAPTATEVVEPFKHARVLVADFTVAEKVIQHAIRELARSRFLMPSPTVILHPDLQLEGGLTPIEERAIREMAFGAGARHVLVHEGDRLTDEQVIAFEE